VRGAHRFPWNGAKAFADAQAALTLSGSTARGARRRVRSVRSRADRSAVRGRRVPRAHGRARPRRTCVFKCAAVTARGKAPLNHIEGAASVRSTRTPPGRRACRAAVHLPRAATQCDAARAELTRRAGTKARRMMREARRVARRLACGTGLSRKLPLVALTPWQHAQYRQRPEGTGLSGSVPRHSPGRDQEVRRAQKALRCEGRPTLSLPASLTSTARQFGLPPTRSYSQPRPPVFPTQLKQPLREEGREEGRQGFRGGSETAR
jgi:hypothetical protein